MQKLDFGQRDNLHRPRGLCRSYAEVMRKWLSYAAWGGGLCDLWRMSLALCRSYAEVMRTHVAWSLEGPLCDLWRMTTRTEPPVERDTHLRRSGGSCSRSGSSGSSSSSSGSGVVVVVVVVVVLVV